MKKEKMRCPGVDQSMIRRMLPRDHVEIEEEKNRLEERELFFQELEAERKLLREVEALKEAQEIYLDILREAAGL